jgi:predicted secreted protein
MGTHHGNGGVVKVGSNTVAEVKEWQVSTKTETVDDSSMGDAWETHLVGKKSWTASANCHWDETDTNGQEALTDGASVTLNLYPEGTATGAKYLTGTATVEAIEIGVPQDGVVSRNFQFKGNGALTLSTAA